MKQLLISRRTFTRFMFTYVFIVLLMLLLFIPIYQNSFTVVHDNMTRELCAGVDQGLALFEEELLSLHTLAQKLPGRQDFILARSLDNELKTSDHVTLSQANKYLGDVTVTLGMSSDVLVLFSKNHYVLSDKRLYVNSEKEMDFFLKYDSMSFSELYELLFSKSYYQDFFPVKTFTTPEAGPQQVLTFVMSMPLLGQQSKHSVLAAIIPVKEIIGAMGLNELEAIALIEIRSSTGLVLYRANSSQELPDIKEQVSANQMFDSKEYTFYKAIGTSTGVTIQIGIPGSYYNELLRPVSRAIMNYLVAAVLIGIVVSLLFTYTNAKPIQSILVSLSHLNSKTQRLERNGFRNDFQYIEGALLSMQADNNSMEEENRNLKETVYSKLFENLVNFSLTAGEMEQFQRMYPDFPKEYRLAVVDSPVPHNLYHTLSHSQLPGLYLFIFQQKVLVFIKEGQLSVNELKDAFQSVLLAHRNATVAVSTVFSGLDSVCNAYKQALYLAKFLEGERMVFADADVDRSFYISTRENQKLYDLLLAGEGQKARQVIYRQWYELSMLPYPDDRIENLFCAQLGILSSAILHLKADFKLPVYNDRLSISQLAFMIGDKADEFSRLAAVRRMQYEETEQENLVAYVNAHCFRETFTLNALEEVFGSSLKTLSKQFKDLTGMSLSEYVEMRRLNRAEEMLKENHLNVNEIAAGCGFGSQNTLYKVFKRVHGVSPTAYRDNYVKLGSE